MIEREIYLENNRTPLQLLKGRHWKLESTSSIFYIQNGTTKHSNIQYHFSEVGNK